MSDYQSLARRIERAAARIDLPLSDRDLERMAMAAPRRRRVRAVRRLFLATAAVGAVAFVIAIGVGAKRRGAIAPGDLDSGGMTARAKAAPADDGVLRFADGSVATPMDSNSVLAVVRDSPRDVLVEVRRGGGRFEVVPAPAAARSFAVGTGDVTVTVVGTVFVVERMADRVGVTVERGTVRVEWKVGPKIGEQILERGDSGWFPPLVIADGMANGPDAGTAPAGPPARRDLERLYPKRAAVAEDRRNGRGHPKEMAEELLSAADAARGAGHPEEGAAILQRLLRLHGDDPRAPLAAFTLGRLLLMELGRPSEAAAAFALVRARAPHGPLAEDALVREVEAWSRAQRPEEARARAEEYLRLYPNGSRAHTVRSLGGIK